MVFSIGRKRKAQLSVEFFLILSIIIAFSIILYNISRTEVANTKTLNAAAISKSSLDSLAQAVDFVALSGNGSALNVSVFVPREANCFYYNTTRGAYYCVVSSQMLPAQTASHQRVFSLRVTSLLDKNFDSSCTTAIQSGQGGLSAGWWELRAQSNGDYVNVSCSRR